MELKEDINICVCVFVFHIQVGEVWSEVCTEIKEEFRPVASDEEALKVISEVSENVGRSVAALQIEVLESQHRREIREEEKTYTKVCLCK